VQQQLDPIFEKYAGGAGPGLVVGIAQTGRETYRRAFGLSSVEDGSPNTVGTRMHIGSSTKQFTCLGVLLLAEDGLLSIDDDIRTHLPELPEYQHRVAIRKLMSNTSGLRCYLDLIGLLASMDRWVPEPRARQLQMLQHSVNFAPGERLLYCNGGFLLLSLLIERLSGMPLAEFFSKRIFEPLAMTATALEPNDTKLIEGVATLHQRYPDGSYHRGTLGVPITGDGAIVSSVEDMLRWLAHMNAPHIGNAATWKTLLTAGSNTVHGYGFGLMQLNYRGVRTIQHGGTVFGGRCQLLKVPDHGIDVVMMSNASDIFPAELTDRVLDVLLEGKLGLPLAPAEGANARRFAGTYYSAQTGDEVTVVVKDDRAFVEGESGEQPLYEIGDGGFKTNLYSLGITLHAARREGDETLEEIELGQGGFRATLHRVDSAKDAPDLAVCCGTYENADCEAQATVSNNGTRKLAIRSRYGAAEYTLEHLSGDAWFAHLQDSWFPLKLRVEFIRSSDDASAFYISSDRTKRLQFNRMRQN